MFPDYIDTIAHVIKADEEVGLAMQAELNRQRRNLELIASENIVSPAVMAAMGSVLTNKYAEGYPSKRYYGGCESVDVVETIAIERAKKLFGAEAANVQPHSGAQANMAAYAAILEPGDVVMGMNLAHGGHLTHGSPVNASGKLYKFVPYGVNDDGFIDYDELEKTANEVKPKLIVAGASAYPRVIDFERIGKIAKSIGAYFMVDMAHIAGLVAAGLHPSPVPYADIVTTTTHKTLRGPRGGLILSTAELAPAIGLDKIIAALILLRSFIKRSIEELACRNVFLLENRACGGHAVDMNIENAHEHAHAPILATFVFLHLAERIGKLALLNKADAAISRRKNSL